jgi:hypothetical protein
MVTKDGGSFKWSDKVGVDVFAGVTGMLVASGGGFVWLLLGFTSLTTGTGGGMREEIVGRSDSFEQENISRALHSFECFPVEVPHLFMPHLCRKGG